MRLPSTGFLSLPMSDCLAAPIALATPFLGATSGSQTFWQAALQATFERSSGANM